MKAGERGYTDRVTLDLGVSSILLKYKVRKFGIVLGKWKGR